MSPARHQGNGNQITVATSIATSSALDDSPNPSDSERASWSSVGYSPTGPDLHESAQQYSAKHHHNMESENAQGSYPLRDHDMHNNNGSNVYLDVPRSTDEDEAYIPSNETLLLTAFMSFMSFALLQLVFAFVAGSQAMMGDSAAMIVDALTYLFNWVAERRKKRFDADFAAENEEICLDTSENGDGTSGNHETPLESTPNATAICAVNAQRATRIHERTKRQMVLRLEIIPPVISVTTLAVVTIIVTHKAIKVLVLDAHRNADQQQRPNVTLMLAFSILNLFLDGLNVFCFARAKHLMGYAVVEDATPVRNDHGHTASNTHVAVHDAHDHANLNMCSAYTHVFADTLRSIAVIVAALTAELVPRVTPEEADATAAVIVSILIVLSLIPLVQGLVRSVSELKALQAEERSDCLLRRSDSESLELT